VVAGGAGRVALDGTQRTAARMRALHEVAEPVECIDQGQVRPSSAELTGDRRRRRRVSLRLRRRSGDPHDAARRTATPDPLDLIQQYHVVNHSTACPTRPFGHAEVLL
jgi:hypothetical protein